jgi:cyclic pyranopterin phosphate synthase
MVDVGAKPATVRTATAEGRVRMRPETLALALAGDAKKGDVRAAAEIAGVMAAKKTADLIPLCHPLPLTGVDVAITPDEAAPGFLVRASVRTTAPTGVEMEALTAVSVACLTLYDMLKAADRHMTIEAIRVTEKSGGASGDFKRDDAC